MSTQTVILNNGQQAILDTDVSKIFVFDNRFETGSRTNSGYDDENLVAGTVMGRVSATGKLVPMQSDASDGSEIPVGILNKDWVIAAGATQAISICVSGDVVEGKLIFTKVGDDLDTVVDGRNYRDRIGGDTVGVKLVPSTENTGFDNA